MKNLSKRISMSALISVILIGLFLVTINLEYNRVIEEERKDLERYVELLKSDVDRLLKHRIINLRGFIPHIQLNPDITQDEFVEFASRLLSNDDVVIRDIAFVTDTTITHVYPMEGNEAIMGVDLTTLKGQREVVLMVKEKGEIVLDGPFEIIEGGLGIICRIPVFMDSKREPSNYLGQLNYAVDFEVFLEETGLKNAADLFRIKVIQTSGIDGSEKVIINNTEEFSKAPVVSKLQLPNAVWEITIENKGGFTGYSVGLYLLCVVGAIVVVLSLYTTNIILKKKFALENSLRELKETQYKLIMSEKLAALGSLTARVAYDINGPLENSISTVSYAQRGAQRISNSLRDGKLTKNDMELFLEENKLSHDLLKKSLGKIVGLIDKFKLITSNENEIVLSKIELNVFTEELINNLKNKQDKELLINYYLDDIVAYSDSRALTKIIENLFDNSIVHGFANRNTGEINIKLYRDDLNKGIVIEYWDNGVGIDEDIRDEIFSPFYSTKLNNDHAGVGLYIVFNAVVNILNGSIELTKNQEGEDVFILFIPEKSEYVISTD